MLTQPMDKRQKIIVHGGNDERGDFRLKIQNFHSVYCQKHVGAVFSSFLGKNELKLELITFSLPTGMPQQIPMAVNAGDAYFAIGAAKGKQLFKIRLGVLCVNEKRQLALGLAFHINVTPSHSLP